jgi:ankyrin repeat protein
VSLLVEHGAPVNTRDRFGSSPLHEAARGGHLQCVDVLLRHRASVLECSSLVGG